MIKNRVAKNAIWIIALRIIQSILSFIVGMLTARYLGPSNYGLIGYASSVVSFFVPIMQLGITNIMVQHLVEKKELEGTIVGTAVFLNFVSSLMCVLGVFLFTFVFNYGETETIVVCTLYSLTLIFQSVEILNYWYQSKLLSKYASISSIIAYFCVSLYKIFLLISQKGVAWFAISNSIDYLIIGILFFVIYFRLGGKKLSISKEMAKELFSKGHYYILSSLMVTIFAHTDRIMIKHMLGADEVGFYSAAVTIAAMFGFVFSAIIDSFRPMIFESKKISEESFENKMCALYSTITYLSLTQCIFMTVFSGIIISVIYGEQYEPSVNALRIVVWYTTFSYYGSVRNIWILSENKQRYLWIINLSGAVSNIILNWIFIPIWSIYGASFASLLTQFFTNVIIGFIMLPIRKNNNLLIRGLSPKYLFGVIKKLKEAN